MTLLKNIFVRTSLLALVNILIFIGLVYASIFFEFLILGWGASANSPDFNVDLTSITQIIILGFLAYRRKKVDLAVVSLLILTLYITLKFGINYI